MFYLGHSARLQPMVRLLHINVVSLLLTSLSSQMLGVQNTEF